jgi:hypothetical protein
MLDEGLATTIVIGGITGAGLLLTVYALMTPLIERMFSERKEKIKQKRQEFNKISSQLTVENFNKNSNALSNLTEEIKSLSKFPRYLREAIFVDFTLFIVTAFAEAVWLNGNHGFDIISGDIMPVLFFSAIIIFGFIGLYAFADVSGWMEKEFEKATIEKEEVEKAYKAVEAAGSAGIKVSATVETKKVEGKKEEDKTQK